ncbi:MAG: hypothetical protein ACP5N3_00990 [Candidatus Nanoarchaeia archaeon]
MVRVLKLLAAFFIMFTALYFVSAMSGSPSMVTIIYEPSEGIDQEFVLSFGSTNQRPGFADVNFIESSKYTQFVFLGDGDSVFTNDQIGKYVTLSKNELDLSKEGRVTVKIKIPPNEPIAGPHEFGVMAAERPSGSGMFVITTSVIIRVRVDAPFPGQYLDIMNFEVKNVNEGENSNFTWQVKGRGDIPTTFSANAEFFSDKGESLVIKNLGTATVARGEAYPLALKEESIATSNLKPGVYKGTLTVKFADSVKNRNVTFRVGQESVVLDNYTPKILAYGEINQVNLIVRNLWNGRFDNTYAVISINGTEATTPSKVLDPFSAVYLDQYIDTRALPVGTYNANITVYFGSKSTVFPVVFEVAIPEPAEVAVSPEKKGISRTVLMAGVALLVIIIIIVIILLLMKKNKKKEQSSEGTKAQISQKNKWKKD